MISAGTVSTRRASSRNTSSVASSAQCTSSSTNTVGARARSSRASAATSSCGITPRATSSASSPPASSATTSSGPSGRGVNSGSQLPQRIRADRPRSSQNCRRSAVFPTPASPLTSTIRPREPRRTLSRHSPSAESSSARSSSSLAVCESSGNAAWRNTLICLPASESCTLDHDRRAPREHARQR